MVDRRDELLESCLPRARKDDALLATPCPCTVVCLYDSSELALQQLTRDIFSMFFSLPHIRHDEALQNILAGCTQVPGMTLVFPWGPASRGGAPCILSRPAAYIPRLGHLHSTLAQSALLLGIEGGLRTRFCEDINLARYIRQSNSYEKFVIYLLSFPGSN